MMALPLDSDPWHPARLFAAGRACLALVVLALAGGLTGCAVPAEVEGIFRGEQFVVRDPRPASKATAAGQDVYLVLAEKDAETLRTVTVRLPRIEALPLDTPIEVGPGDARHDHMPVVDVAEGKLLVEERSDGAQILSSEDPTFATSTSGTLTLTAKDKHVAGSFKVDLDDGGWLDGVFVVRAPAVE